MKKEEWGKRGNGGNLHNVWDRGCVADQPQERAPFRAQPRTGHHIGGSEPRMGGAGRPELGQIRMRLFSEATSRRSPFFHNC